MLGWLLGPPHRRAIGSGRSRWSLVAAAALGLLAAGAGGQGDRARGRELSQRHCALCHVIGEYNKDGGIESTPSFQMLASMKDGEARFRSFFARPPHPAFVDLPDRARPTDLPLTLPPVHLTRRDVEDIVAFALTLRASRFIRDQAR